MYPPSRQGTGETGPAEDENADGNHQPQATQLASSGISASQNALLIASESRSDAGGNTDRTQATMLRRLRGQIGSVSMFGGAQLPSAGLSSTIPLMGNIMFTGLQQQQNLLAEHCELANLRETRRQLLQQYILQNQLSHQLQQNAGLPSFWGGNVASNFSSADVYRQQRDFLLSNTLANARAMAVNQNYNALAGLGRRDFLHSSFLSETRNLGSFAAGSNVPLTSLQNNYFSGIDLLGQTAGLAAANGALIGEAASGAIPALAGTQEEQPEMNDAEYFELFGFNDEDGVQIINETFPHKLYRMFFEVERNKQEDIVSFFPHGKAFIVKNSKRFVEEIMPKYFSTSRMSSFQRQLNLYGFQRIDDGPEKGGFFHQYFQKGQRSLCNRIKRHKSKPGSSKAGTAATGSCLVQNRVGTAAAAAAATSNTSVPQERKIPASASADLFIPQNQLAQRFHQGKRKGKQTGDQEGEGKSG